MSKFIRLAKFETEFEGDKIAATIGALSFEDALRYEEAEGVSEDSKLMIEFIEKYATDFTGLTDSSGALVTLKDMVREAYFHPLILELGKFIIKQAYPDRPKKPAAISGS